MNRRGFLSTTLAAGAVLAAPSLARGSQVGAIDGGDIAILRDLLTTLHPGLYRYNSPIETERQLAELERLWQRESGLEQRYLALSAFLGTIRCGHSYANFFNQSREGASALFDRPTRLPLPSAGSAMKW